MRPTRYEPSTSGWNVVNHRRRERRRIVRLAVGSTLLLAGAIVGPVLAVGPAQTLDLVR
jgi:hypothetical protein